MKVTLRFSLYVCFFSVALPAASPSATPMVQQANSSLGYYYFLHHVAALQQAADKSVSNGGPDVFRHYFRDKLRLSLSEESDLNHLASEFTLQTQALTSKMIVIRNLFWTQYPPGKTPLNRIPPPPAELASLEKQRQELTLEARSRLRSLFDADSFSRIDQFVNLTVVPKIHKFSAANIPSAK